MTTKMIERAVVTADISIQITEAQFRALVTVAAFSHDLVCDMLAKSLTHEFEKNGKHRDGLTSLLDAVRNESPDILRRIDSARAAFVRPKEPNP